MLRNRLSSIIIVSAMMLAVTLIIALNGCQESSGAGGRIDMPYMNPDLPVQERVEDLLGRMTLEEKVAQMCQYVGLEHMRRAEKNLTREQLLQSDAEGFYPGLHSSEVEEMVRNGMIGSFLHVVDLDEANYLQSLALESRLKIPLLIGIDAVHGTALVKGATVYPTPISMAATWDTSLVRRIAKETAEEMRYSGSSWTFAPNIDIARDPRWGRVGETFGEDPFLVSMMGAAMINGLQGRDFSDSLNVLACAKHLIGGGESVNGLNGAPTDISERTLREIHLPPYSAAIDAGVFSMMTAHNELNGVPCHANKWLMNDIVRGEMGFEGFFVSDWMDIERLATRHYLVSGQEQACLATIESGMDMHMHGPGFLEPVVKMVKAGIIDQSRIDDSVSRILEAKFRLGLFEKAFVNRERSREVLFNPVHRATALEAASKSVVLLKNSTGILPINRKEIRKIFVTGPNADNQTILGDWSEMQPEENVTTILEGLRECSDRFDIDYMDVGYNPMHVTEDHVREATSRAAKADLAILVVGENSFRWEWSDKTNGENSARASVDLAGLQNDLVEAVYATGTPVVLVVVGGRPLALGRIADEIPSIIYAWEPGSLGGEAVAAIITGRLNPSGKLPVTLPRSVGHILSVYNHKPTNYFHSYVTEETEPLFPFGHGLSYTDFYYENLEISDPTIKPGEGVKVKVEVTNTGSVPGEEVVQFYLRDEISSVTRPVKELKGFQRINLNPGETKLVVFDVEPEMLQFLDIYMKNVIESGRFIAMVGGSSDDRNLLKIPFIVK